MAGKRYDVLVGAVKRGIPVKIRLKSLTWSVADVGFSLLFLLAVFALPALIGGDLSVASAQSAAPSAKTRKPKALKVSPKKLSFGDLPPLKASAPETVTIHNPNSVAINVSSVASANPEFVPSGNCVGSLVADGDCAVSVVFTASSDGKKSAKLTIVNSASRKALSVSMKGEGKGPPLPSPTPTATATQTETMTSTPTATATATATASATETATATATETATATATDTLTATATATTTETATQTQTPTGTATVTATITQTATPTATASDATPTATATATETATGGTPTATATATPTVTATATSTATATLAATATPTPVSGAAAVTDTNGNATLTSGPMVLPVHLTDSAGNPVAAMPVALGFDSAQAGTAVLVFGQNSDAFPLQFKVLYNPSSISGSSIAKTAAPIATDTSPPVAVAVSDSCVITSGISITIAPPLPSPDVPASLAPLTAVQFDYYVVEDATQGVLNLASSNNWPFSYIDSGPQDGDACIMEVIAALPIMPSMYFEWLEFIRFGPEIADAFQTAYKFESTGEIPFRSCFSAEKNMFTRRMDVGSNDGLLMFWAPMPDATINPPPLSAVAWNAMDGSGNPLPSTSTVASTDLLGSGTFIPTDASGTSTAILPANDAFAACTESPYLPQDDFTFLTPACLGPNPLTLSRPTPAAGAQSPTTCSSVTVNVVLTTPTPTATPTATPTPTPAFYFEVLSNPLPSAPAGAPYSYYFCDPPPAPGQDCGSLSAPVYDPAGGGEPYTFTTVGSPPAGLALDTQTGQLSGTPISTDAGSTTPFTICATDSTADVVCQPTSIFVDAEAGSYTMSLSGTLKGPNTDCATSPSGSGSATFTGSGSFQFTLDPPTTLLGGTVYDGFYNITGSLTISQGAGICDDYSGTYTCGSNAPFGCGATETGTGENDIFFNLEPDLGTTVGCGSEGGILFSGSFDLAPNGNTASCDGTDCVNDLSSGSCGDTDTESFTMAPSP